MMISEKLLSFIHRHRGYIETSKILLISGLALISLFVSIYVLWASPWTGFRFLYVFIPHLYLIPIILLALWYPKSGIKLIGIILISVIAFWIFSEIFGYQFSISFVMLYTGLDLATIMVLLLYVKDRRLVEAVLSDFIERTESKNTISLPDRFGGDFDTIINALSSPDDQDREEAVDALSELSDKRAILPLINSLKDENIYIRFKAAEALGRSGSQKAVKPLIQLLSDNDRRLRESAAEALGHLGTVALPKLIRELDNPDWVVRVGILVAFRISKEPLPNLDPVLNSLRDNSPYVRREAVKTLGRIGDKSTLPYLLESIEDPDAGVRLRTVNSICRIGSDDEIISIMKRLSNDQDPKVRIRVEEVLQNREK